MGRRPTCQVFKQHCCCTKEAHAVTSEPEFTRVLACSRGLLQPISRCRSCIFILLQTAFPQSRFLFLSSFACTTFILLFLFLQDLITLLSSLLLLLVNLHVALLILILCLLPHLFLLIPSLLLLLRITVCLMPFST